MSGVAGAPCCSDGEGRQTAARQMVMTMLDQTRLTAGREAADVATEKQRQEQPVMAALALYPPRGRHGLDPRDASRFAARLQAFRQHHAALYDARGKGGLFILDLAEIRRRFAARWPAMQEKAHHFIEGLLARRLGAADLYLAVNGERFWLLLTDSDRATAERLARRLAAEITERLCGIIAGGVACRLITTRFDLAKGLAGVADPPALERRVEAALAGKPDLVAASSAGWSPCFTPVLSPKKRQISIHALTRAAADNAPPSGTPADDEHAAASDCWAVAEAATILADRGFRAAVAIELHYATLATMRHRQKLILAYRRLPAAARRRLVIELVGLPDTLPQARVRELVSYLRPFTVGVLVAVEPAALGRQTKPAPRPGDRAVQLDQLASTGIAGLSLDLATSGHAGSVAALIARAKGLGIRTLCHVGIDRRNLRAALIAGIDHIAGEALFPSTVRPAPIITIGGAMDAS